jgi:hypothetical protein
MLPSLQILYIIYQAEEVYPRLKTPQLPSFQTPHLRLQREGIPFSTEIRQPYTRSP